MKRAQSISINTIVVAAIALVVLILIVLIFTQNIGNWRRSTDRCESVNGQCVLLDDVRDGNACSGQYDQVSRAHACFDASGDVDPDRVCCLSG